jgi:hypothetical protein
MSTDAPPRYPNSWHNLDASGRTQAMNMATGAMVRTTSTDGVALCCMPMAAVARRWTMVDGVTMTEQTSVIDRGECASVWSGVESLDAWIFADHPLPSRAEVLDMLPKGEGGVAGRHDWAWEQTTTGGAEASTGELATIEELHGLLKGMVSSTEALAGLLLVLGVALTSSATDALRYGCLDALPRAQALGMTEDGWRSSVMLRRLYRALSPEHRDLVNSEDLVFTSTLWGMMTGEIITTALSADLQEGGL